MHTKRTAIIGLLVVAGGYSVATSSLGSNSQDFMRVVTQSVGISPSQLAAAGISVTDATAAYALCRESDLLQALAGASGAGAGRGNGEGLGDISATVVLQLRRELQADVDASLGEVAIADMRTMREAMKSGLPQEYGLVCRTDEACKHARAAIIAKERAARLGKPVPEKYSGVVEQIEQDERVQQARSRMSTSTGTYEELLVP